MEDFLGWANRVFKSTRDFSPDGACREYHDCSLSHLRSSGNCEDNKTRLFSFVDAGIDISIMRPLVIVVGVVTGFQQANLPTPTSLFWTVDKNRRRKIITYD